MMLGADHLGPRFNTITLKDSHPVPLPRERQAHYGIYDPKGKLVGGETPVNTTGQNS